MLIASVNNFELSIINVEHGMESHIVLPIPIENLQVVREDDNDSVWLLCRCLSQGASDAILHKVRGLDVEMEDEG